MTSKISVLMSNYNNAPYIKEAIKSVLDQSFTDWELIVGDDFSTDGSSDVVKIFLKDRRIKFFRNNENLGTIKTLKKLIEKASSDIIIILDSDDAFRCDALEKVFGVYSKKEAAIVYSQSYYCDKHLNPVHLAFSSQIPANETNLRLNVVHHLKSFRKSYFNKTEGLDQDIKFAEDLDYILKVEEKGEAIFLDEPLYYYRVLPQSQSHGFKNTQINRSSTALAKLNAYRRRLGTKTPNLSKNEISEVLFFGIITSILSGRIKLSLHFLKEIFKISRFFFLKVAFYKQIFKKTRKMLKLKKEKPLLKI